jgi:FkbM family methyltransferase
MAYEPRHQTGVDMGINGALPPLAGLDGRRDARVAMELIDMVFRQIKRWAAITPVHVVRLSLPRRRQFHFRPRRSRDGLHAVQVTARNRHFTKVVLARPRTTDIACMRDVFSRGEYDTRRLARHADIVKAYRPGSLILDLGANAGYTSVYFASQWPQAVIVAVEPDEENFAMLAKNTSGLSVRPLRAAMGNDGWATLSNPGLGCVGLQTHAVEEQVRGAVPSLSMATLLKEYRALNPFICKIDIEGAESDLFDDDVSWVDEFPVLIVELHDWLFPRGGRARSFLKAIAHRDRDFVIFGENVISVRNS